ncbi:MAG: branched-chain amino acid ABC transporter permease [Candidatus Hodarchaeota archaeon]
MATAITAVILSGITLGSIYVLLAAGLSLCWGTIRIWNFGHGALVMLGAYIAWYLLTVPELSFLGYGPIIMIACGFTFFLGMAIERILVHPLMEEKDIIVKAVLTTLAASIFIQNSVLLGFGPRAKQLPATLPGVVKFSGVALSYHDLLIMVMGPGILTILWVFLKKTKIGAAIRSVEQCKDAAFLVGIDVHRIYSLTFGISVMMSTVGGIMLGSIYVLSHTMGASIALKAFIIVVIGGSGSIVGTLLAGYVVAMIESFSIYFVGLFWAPIVLFTAMIVILVIRPKGFLGEEVEL